MNSYVIYTDSGCDISPALLAEWGVPAKSLTFRFAEDDVEYSNNDMAIKTFYDKMRAGGVAKTAAVNTESFRDGFEGFLKQGMDVLYLGFSSGLSTTFNSARLAAAELGERYPDRKILTVDTLAASLGEGLLVYYAAKLRDEGKTIEEIASWLEANKLNLCHWFTVDDLHFLKRGGRVSAATAVVGSMLQIKPVMHVDNEGHLIKVTTARGRRASIKALFDKIGETAIDPEKQVYFISHGDCIGDAELLASMISEKYGNVKIVIDYVGAVIGAHSGPGTLALFFLGTVR